MNKKAMIAPMATRVVRALPACGCLNAETPLEMASTPVSAVTPAEKACRTRNSVSGTMAAPAPSSAWGSA
jgi:hypothetical protein